MMHTARLTIVSVIALTAACGTGPGADAQRLTPERAAAVTPAAAHR